MIRRIEELDTRNWNKFTLEYVRNRLNGLKEYQSQWLLSEGFSALFVRVKKATYD